MKTVTAETLIKGCRTAAELYPDRVVSYCSYFDNGEPNCLVGYALSLAGFEEADLQIASYNSLNEDGVWDLVDNGILDGTVEEFAWLHNAQEFQDAASAHPQTEDAKGWAEAVKFADDQAERAARLREDYS